MLLVGEDYDFGEDEIINSDHIQQELDDYFDGEKCGSIVCGRLGGRGWKNRNCGDIS